MATISFQFTATGYNQNYIVYLTPLTPPAAPKPLSLAQVERELDIIRGVIPTPRGYKIDKTRVAWLMAERRRLNQKSRHKGDLIG